MHEEVCQSAGLFFRKAKLRHDRARRHSLGLAKVLDHPIGRTPQANIIERWTDRSAFTRDGVAADAALLLEQPLTRGNARDDFHRGVVPWRRLADLAEHIERYSIQVRLG